MGLKQKEAESCFTELIQLVLCSKDREKSVDPFLFQGSQRVKRQEINEPASM